MRRAKAARCRIICLETSTKEEIKIMKQAKK
jgi:hypothetical protein